MEEKIDWSQISRSDQRSYIKIETLRGKKPTEIQNALHEICGDSAVDRSTVSRWASRFREGWVSIQDDPRSLMPRVQYRKFWRSMDGMCFPTLRTVLT